MLSLEVRLHDASNASNIGHLYDVTHHVAVVHMANDKCQASNVGAGAYSAACRFFYTASKDNSNIGSNLSTHFYQPATRCDKQLVSRCGRCSVVFWYIITYCELVSSWYANFIRYNFFPNFNNNKHEKIELLLPPRILSTLIPTLAPTFVLTLQFNIRCIV